MAGMAVLAASVRIKIRIRIIMGGIADESGSRAKRILEQGSCSDRRLLEIEIPAQILNPVVTEIHWGP